MDARQGIAQRYRDLLADFVETPTADDDSISAWTHYTIRLGDRHRVASALRQTGVPTAIYYPRALSELPTVRDAMRDPQGLPIALSLGARVLSVPMHSYLEAVETSRRCALAAARRR